LEKKIVEILQNGETLIQEQVKIGFRKYEEEGLKEENGQKYTGWGSRYDEWKSVTCPTI